MAHWGGTLERRGPNSSCTFARADVDRMAVAYAAYRTGSPAWYEPRTEPSPRTQVKSPRERLHRASGNVSSAVSPALEPTHPIA